MHGRWLAVEKRIFLPFPFLPGVVSMARGIVLVEGAATG